MFIKNKYSFTPDDEKLWRYFSFPKFQSLIDKSSLYFSRIDCFSDSLEATQPNGSLEFARATQNPWQIFTRQCTDKQLEIFRKMTYANCWHINNQENPSMWKNYVTKSGDPGVAVQTSFLNLVGCFKTNRILTNVKMKYIDYNTAFLSYAFPNYPEYLSIKDIKFENENELRIITLEEEYPEYNPDTNTDGKIKLETPKGEFIKVDLSMLIQSIYLSPNSTTDFKEKIERLLLSNKIYVPVRKSKIIYVRKTII